MRFALVLFALSLTGCMFSKKPAQAPAPAPVPAPVPVVVKPPAAAPEPQRPPVTTVPEPAPAPPAPDPTVITTPATMPAKPKPVARKSKPAKPVQPPVAPSVSVPPPTPAPKLGEMLTPAEQAEMNRTVDQSTAAARVTLSRLQGRKLTAEQASTADRIRTFASQAEQARKTDLRSAAQLARRAAVLARDLEASLK